MSPPERSEAAGVSGARRVAFEVLRRSFEHGAWADQALRSAAERHGLRDRERASAQRLAYGAVQRRGTTDHIAERLADRPAERLDRAVLAGLRLGLYELLFSDAAAHAVVGEAVALVKGGMRRAGGRRATAAGGFVNAVLRRAAVQGRELLASLDDSSPAQAALAHSYPPWIAELWWRELGGADARALMAAMNSPAERALRINTLRAVPETIVGELRQAGERVERAAASGAERGAGAAEPLLAPAEAITVDGGWGEALRARIASGELVPQSLASQAVVAVLDPQPGERVLDLCAGPGIKATAIAARLEDRGEVRAVEVDPGRAGRVAELAELLGAESVRVERGDATRVDLGAGYDRVLVDPPCTDLGALSARPDARWRKSAAQLKRLAALQARILACGARALRPGGVLVYSTCTISAAENEELVAGVLGAEPELEAEDLGARHPALASGLDPRFLQLRPDRDGTAGFFVARLRRSGA